MESEQGQNFWNGAEQPQAAPVATEPAPQDNFLTWQASEYVHQEKSGTWFLALVGVAVVLLIFDIFLAKSWTFGALIVVMTVAVAVVARRPPRTVTYTLSPQGLKIDDKLFSFHDFRAFGIIQEGAFYSVRLVPSKRFMPMVSVFFPSEMGESIVDLFGASLPMEHLELDPIDKLVEKLHF